MGCVMDIYYCWMEMVVLWMLVGCLVINVLVGFNDVGLLMGM